MLPPHCQPLENEDVEPPTPPFQSPLSRAARITPNIPHVPQQLDSIFSLCRDTWAHGFLFTLDPIHISFLTQYPLPATTATGRTVLSTFPTLRPVHPSATPDTQLTLDYFFTPTLSIPPLTVGVGACRSTASPSDHPHLPPDSLFPLRILLHQTRNTILLHYDIPAGDASVLVASERSSPTSVREARAVFRRSVFRPLAAAMPHLPVEKLLPALFYFGTSEGTCVCNECLRVFSTPPAVRAPSSVTLSTCSISSNLEVEKAANSVTSPANAVVSHPFDHRNFFPMARRHLGTFRGIASSVVLKDSFPIAIFSNTRFSTVKPVFDKPLVSFLRRSILVDHAQRIVAQPRADAALLLDYPSTDGTGTYAVSPLRGASSGDGDSPMDSRDALFDACIGPLLRPDGFSIDVDVQQQKRRDGTQHPSEIVNDVRISTSASQVPQCNDGNTSVPSPPSSSVVSAPGGSSCNESRASSAPEMPVPLAESLPSTHDPTRLIAASVLPLSYSTSLCGNRLDNVTGVPSSSNEVNNAEAVDFSFPTPHREGDDNNHNNSGSTENGSIVIRQDNTHAENVGENKNFPNNTSVDGGEDDRLQKRRDMLRRRRERNRIAARRSNERVKAAREKLVQDMDEARRALSMLRQRESELRAENVRLRKQVYHT